MPRRDQGVETERLREELRIARWDADVSIRELREENQRLHGQLLECEEALRCVEQAHAEFREEMLGPIKDRHGSVESMSWDELLGVAVRNLNLALRLDDALRDLMSESKPWLEPAGSWANAAMAKARGVIEQ